MDATTHLQSDMDAVIGKLLGPVSAAELDAAYGAAIALFERAELSRAADLFRYVALADPLRVEAWHGLALCHERLGDLHVAADLFELAWIMGGGDAPMAVEAVRVRRAAGDEAAAAAFSRRAALGGENGGAS